MIRTLRYLLFPVLNILGMLLIPFGILLGAMASLSHMLQDGASDGFAIAAVASCGIGVAFYAVSKHDKRELMARDGFLLATSAWVLIPLLSSIPLVLSIPQADFAHAFFEAMSGITTTCASAFSGLDNLPISINFWRCLLCWMGGMGILVLAVGILPLLGVGGAQMFRAEASGPIKDNKLTPRLADSAKGLWWIYALLTAACALAYGYAGMTPLDAIEHAFTTVSLGGFSSHDLSFGYWNSPAIEAVCVGFILIGGMSFSLHFLMIRKRSFSVYRNDPEIRGWLLTVFLASAAVVVYLRLSDTYDNWFDACRYGIFNLVSVISTTGYMTTDYGQWPVAIPILMLVLASFATCAGSTGGGIKMLRAIILVKQLSRGFTQTLHARAVVPLRLEDRVIPDPVVFTVLNYALLWISTVVIASIALLLTGLDSKTALSAALACITNTGPGLEVVGPASNFSSLSTSALWICSWCMLVGRLELMTVFVIFTRSFWRI